MNHGNLGIRVYGGAYNMSSDWQENLDVMMLSLTRIQGDIDRIPSSRSRILTDTQQLLQNMNSEAIQLMSMLKYIEDLGFQDSND
jgi:uncharacterized protein YoxC